MAEHILLLSEKLAMPNIIFPLRLMGFRLLCRLKKIKPAGYAENMCW